MIISVGDLVFMKNESVLSKAIRLVSTGKIGQEVPSHVAIVLNVLNDDIELIEANYTGVRRIMLSKHKNCTFWFAQMRSPRAINLGIYWAISQKGKGYDYTALISIFLRSFVRLLSPAVYNRIKFLRNLLESKMRWFCSEYVCFYARETGKDLWHHAPSETTPYDVFRSPEIILYGYKVT